MKLLPKFALLSIGVAAVPLAIAGYSSARISQQTLRQQIEEHELMIARQVAEYVSSHLSGLESLLAVEARVVRMFGWSTDLPTATALHKYLQLVYHQSDDFSAVALFDANGTALASPVYQESPRQGSFYGRHEAMRPEDVQRLARLAPLGEAVRDGSAISTVFLGGASQTPHVVLAVTCSPVPDQPPVVLAAAVSLRRFSDHLAALSRTDDVLLLDRHSRLIASARAPGPGDLEPRPLPLARPGYLPDEPEKVGEYEREGRRVIAAYARARPYQMGVVVEQRIEAAMSPVRRLTWATLYWVSVSGLIAAVVGAFLARRLSIRVGALAEGARKIAQGKLDTQLKVVSKDELGELAKAFNAMATSLGAARTEILRQTDEILAWNDTLERRVDQKTKELRETQDLLLRSRSLAAIGSLGAGVAHEINNPLTGVLGMSQLLLTDLHEDHPSRPMIQDIADQALRIQQIVANLLRLAQRQSGEDFSVLDLSTVIDDALELCGPMALADGGVRVVKNVASPSPPVRGNALQLQAALIQLIQNARNAMETGGTLTLETGLPEPKLLRLRVSDTGKGIQPDHLPRIFDPFFTTKARRTDTGIGLSVVHKIIVDHGGTIRVESAPGLGTTFWLTLPIDTGKGHLA